VSLEERLVSAPMRTAVCVKRGLDPTVHERIDPTMRRLVRSRRERSTPPT